jgi:hypothetical protein
MHSSKAGHVYHVFHVYHVQKMPLLMLVPACIAAADDTCWKERLPKKQSSFRLTAAAAEPV